MSSDSVHQTVSDAVTALKAGKNSEALRLLDVAVEGDPTYTDAYALRGIAFAQVGRAEAATESFRKAVSLDPSSKNLYNLAVHFHNIGEKALSRETAEKSLAVEPENAAAAALLKVIEAEGENVFFSVDGAAIGPTPLARKRRYGYGKKHLFAVLAENQEPWVALGWTIVGFAVVAAVLMKISFPLVAPAKVSMNSPFMGFKPANSPVAFGQIAFFITSILASMIWTSVDLIDRRGRALWMVPMMLCCFLFLPFLPQALYMAIGRRDGN